MNCMASNIKKFEKLGMQKMHKIYVDISPSHHFYYKKYINTL